MGIDSVSTEDDVDTEIAQDLGNKATRAIIEADLPGFCRSVATLNEVATSHPLAKANQLREDFLNEILNNAS